MEITFEIIKRIQSGCTVENICESLNLTFEEFYLLVQDYNEKNVTRYYSKICHNADIIMSKNQEPLDSDVNLTVPDGIFSLVGISDTHVGNEFDTIDRFKAIADFINEENIKLLVNCGDLVDGPDHDNQHVGRRLPLLENQIEELIINYPFISGANICMLGDHDARGRTEDGYTVCKALREFRPDLKVFGSDSGIVKINNKEILLCHDLKNPNVRNNIIDDRIVLAGHSHAFYNHTKYTTSYGPAIEVVIPAFCNLPLHNDRTPGFLKIDLTYSNGNLVGVLIHNYTFEGAGSHILYNGSVPYSFEVTKKEQSKQRKRK